MRGADRSCVYSPAAFNKPGDDNMSVAKIVEITAESPQSFEAAIKHGIERASQTLKNIQTAWVKEQTVVIKEGKPAAYRVDLKVTFMLE
jgi:dodecin